MRYPARMMIVGSLIQVPLSGALVLGYFGAPKLGLFGAAVSVIATSAVMAVIILQRLVRLNYRLICGFRASGYDSITFKILAALRFQPRCRLSQPSPRFWY